MFDQDDYTQATAEELAKGKTKVRNKRSMQFGKDRNRQGESSQDGKYTRPLRTLESQNDDLAGIDLKRVTKLSDVESES